MGKNLNKGYELKINVTGSKKGYWNDRYKSEGKIWGDVPSPTAAAATQHLKNNSKVLDIGCGYGRDLSFLIKRGHKVCGIDSSPVSLHYMKEQGYKNNVHSEYLINKKFEDTDLPDSCFDGIISHRFLHLLVKQDSVTKYIFKIWQILRKGGILCIGTRSPNDFKPSEMLHIGDGIYEYKNRPGHKIRFWDKNSFIHNFSDYFKIKSITEITEKESMFNPIPVNE
jgi:SAM-dependent methyltransferase